MRLGLLLVLTGSFALAQRPAARGGSVLYPGGAPSRTSGGFRGVPTTARPVVSHPAHSRSFLVPYPVYFAAPGPIYAAPPAQYGPGVEGVASDPGDSQPPVMIVNQSFRPDTANPVIRDYSNTPLRSSEPPPPPDDTPNYYLIALKDHSIETAIAYWVQDDTLSYITLQDQQKHVSLESVDADFTKQLNLERRIQFKLPSK